MQKIHWGHQYMLDTTGINLHTYYAQEGSLRALSAIEHEKVAPLAKGPHLFRYLNTYNDQFIITSCPTKYIDNLLLIERNQAWQLSQRCKPTNGAKMIVLPPKAMVKELLSVNHPYPFGTIFKIKTD